VTIASTPRFIAGPGWPGIAADLLKMFETQLEKNFQKTLERFLAIQAMGSDTAKHDIKTIRQQVTQYPDPAEETLKKRAQDIVYRRYATGCRTYCCANVTALR
jgi:pimeloyl-[acyl-carrier protein] methyl ester esterase